MFCLTLHWNDGWLLQRNRSMIVILADTKLHVAVKDAHDFVIKRTHEEIVALMATESSTRTTSCTLHPL